MNSEDLYEISKYSDRELLNILDLTDPTDRELEARIIFLQRRYQNMQTPAGDQLASFFDDIYNHFFVLPEEEEPLEEDVEIEGMQNMGDTTSGNVKTDNAKSGNVFTLKSIENASNAETAKKGDVNFNATEVNYTTTLNYAGDKLNPLLKQTVKRIISIDSQYRDDKTTMATDFTFNLSDPLKDVVSLKLYSVQIPRTWYTVSNTFGSNFFYLKGNSPGINTGDYDYQIDISAGNYTPENLIAALNLKIQEVKLNNPDTSFGTTNIGYNPNTALTTMAFDIKKQYTETSYELSFPTWSNPNGSSSQTGPRYQSIPGFFGYNEKSYYFNTLAGQKNLLLTTNTAGISSDTLNGLYYIDPSSNTTNYITIIKYIGQNEYNENSIVDLSFHINLSVSGVLSRSQLVNDLRNKLTNNIYLSDSYIKRVDVTNPDVLGYGYSYFELKINYNRLTTNNIENSKTVVIFPNEANIISSYNKIWTGSTSCFRFIQPNNELNNVISETSPIAQQSTSYKILSRPYIYLKCTKTNFDVSENDYTITLPNSSTAGYSLLQYVNAINTAIAATNAVTTTTKNTIGDFNLQNMKSYIDSDSYFNIQFDLNRLFTQDMYNIDLSGSYLTTILDLSGSYLNGISDLSGSTYTFYSTFPQNSTYNVLSDYLLVAKPSSTYKYGNQNTPTLTILSDGSNVTYRSYQQLQNSINSNFENFEDEDGDNIFSGTNIDLSPTEDGYLNCTFTVSMKKLISQQSYRVGFIDASSIDVYNDISPTQSSWYNNLNVGSDYLATQHVATGGVELSTIETGNVSYTKITATYPISVNSISFIDGSNNYFWIKPFEKGVYSAGKENDIKITIPARISNSVIKYTRDNLLIALNIALNENPLTYGSSVSLVMISNAEYTKLRITVNKKYTANDYKLVFYDQLSFLRCYTGIKSIRKTTWDTTIGWLIGFHSSTSYLLSDYGNPGDVIKLTGDTTVSVNLYNYFLLCLDDFNQNHLNDGLVTISSAATEIPLPSYASRTSYTCDPVTGYVTYNTNMGDNVTNNKLTQNQIYSLTEIANSKRISSIISRSSNVTSKSYGSGPFVKDVFGLIPMKTAGLPNGSVYVEFGGTLQNQERVYFGPVNIHRMSVKLVSDRGDIVDLNGSDWSFSLICEQIYQQKPTPEKEKKGASNDDKSSE